jgi:hypothetical protein
MARGSMAASSLFMLMDLDDGYGAGELLAAVIFLYAQIKRRATWLSKLSGVNASTAFRMGIRAMRTGYWSIPQDMCLLLVLASDRRCYIGQIVRMYPRFVSSRPGRVKVRSDVLLGGKR